MNLVFLSNEKQPVVIENDDRRYCVIWTPPKLDKETYKSINKEIKNGGIEALYHHLMQVDLTDFDEDTNPPMTRSKKQLIDINRDTVDAFIQDWIEDGLGCPVGPVLSVNLYHFYQHYCKFNGEPYPRSAKVFNAHIDKLTGWFRGYKDRYYNIHFTGSKKRARVIIPSQVDYAKAIEKGVRVIQRTESQTIVQHITEGIIEFQSAREKQ